MWLRMTGSIPPLRHVPAWRVQKYFLLYLLLFSYEYIFLPKKSKDVRKNVWVRLG
jgi:hypothetical protein